MKHHQFVIVLVFIVLSVGVQLWAAVNAAQTRRMAETSTATRHASCTLRRRSKAQTDYERRMKDYYAVHPELC